MLPIDTIETPVLTLLPLRAEYADEMAVVLSDPGLYTFTGGAPLTAGELRARYERLIAGPPGWCNWVVWSCEEELLVGYVQATIDDGTAEIAWVIGTPWQGRGLATASAKALVDWLKRRGIGTIVAHIHPDHAASAAVATSAGLRPTERWHYGEVRWEWTA
ncbi:GNAT family N-acetyltransferase [Nonomuraea sp. 3N208]|uniref:GNAT family N-acetyltransferase n=1 Tax=Nonomuraea sp. 3N208 TaxID=3457421 RepID=UPI003FD010D3